MLLYVTLFVVCTCDSHINEDRRKTEGQMQMFEVLRDVEGCPVSGHQHNQRRGSHRQLNKCETV